LLVVDGIALCEPDLSLDRERRPRAAGRLLGDPTTYGSDYFLSKVFGITIHAAMLSSVHLCCNVLSEHDTGEKGMMPSSINTKTFKLYKKGSTTTFAAAVSYSDTTDTATLDPSNNLQRGVTYKAVVTTGATDVAGNPLEQQYKWFFTVG
jgi:hypothetical protein